MNLIQMRRWARRRLLDTGAQQRFNDADIDSALNVGAQQVQAEIDRVNKNAFRRIVLRDLEADTYRYQNPRGLLRYVSVQCKYPTFTKYVKADPTTEDEIENPDSELRRSYPNAGGVFFAVSGGELILFPTPTAAVEDGLRLRYIPVLGMSQDDDDLDDLGLLQPFHIAVILWGVKLLLPEDGEDSKGVDAEIMKVMDRVPDYYGGTGQQGSQEFIRVQGIGKELFDTASDFTYRR